MDTSGCRKWFVVDHQTCLLEIFDTAGQEEYSVMRDQSIREGEGFLFVFDVNNAESLDKFAEWRELIKSVKEKEKVSSESHPSAIKTEQKVRNAPDRGLFVPRVLSLCLA